MRTKKPILIILGEPNSVFIELLSKVLNKKKVKKKINRPIILIGSENLILAQLKILKKKINFEKINKNNFKLNKLSRKTYLINVNYNFKKAFEKISIKSKDYISNCFDIGLKILNSNQSKIIINGPISKKHFLENKYPGITEYIFYKSPKKISKYPTMLIFNNNLSVCPTTTHIPLKLVSKKIKMKNIINNALNIDHFYKKYLRIKPRIALMGMNPHCESKYKNNEEKKIIKPAIKKLKLKKININGPHSTDTFFIRKNLNYYDSIIGMYHDQVLTPFKTMYGFDASNITLGLPFLRLSVDHGPNETMMGKNKSNTKSLENIFNFISTVK